MAKKPTGYYRFQNYVPVQGYRWIEDFVPAPRIHAGSSPPPPPYLVQHSSQPDEENEKWKVTYPLVKTPLLYKTFQEQTADQLGALSFANRYGWLASDTAVICRKTREIVSVSSLRLWINELHAMQLAAHLWQCVQENDHIKMRKYLRWSQKEYAVQIMVGVSKGMFYDRRKLERSPPTFPFDSLAEWLVLPGHRDEVQRFGPGTGWKHGELSGPTRLAILNVVNARLSKYCHPRLYLGEDGKHVGMLTPVNLLGCLWLQLYQEIAGMQKLRQCAICHKEMDVSENRAHKSVHLECSRRERQKRWRQKRRVDGES